MPIKTTISIISKNDQLKKVTDNITYVNPNISNDVALQLAKKVNALTNNTYESTERTDVTELDNYTPKPNRHIGKIFYTTKSGTLRFQNIYSGETSVTVPVSDLAVSDGRSIFSIAVYTALTAVPQLFDIESTIGTWTQSNAPTFNYNNGDSYMGRKLECDQLITEPMTFAFTIHIDESPNYAEYNFRVTVNVTADE